MLRTDDDQHGLFDNYADAEETGRGADRRTIDDAEMKYGVIHLHRLIEPEGPGHPSS